jgi:hypothetical protein
MGLPRNMVSYGIQFHGNSWQLNANNHGKALLVGGAITILKNMSSSMGKNIPYIMENKSHV